jgi:xanthine dehydrogenase accessory factor
MGRLVVVKGGGDLATGVVHRLFRAGFSVVVTEIARPTVIRQTVAFATAVYDGEAAVEGVTAVRCELDSALAVAERGAVPVVVDPQAACVAMLRPLAVVDAIMAKVNTGTALTDAPVVIGVGPGFVAGVDVHAVVETMRGHDLGRVITDGSAAANTGIPGEIGGYGRERLITAPATGAFKTAAAIGDVVKAGDTVAYVGDTPVRAAIGGVLRGLLRDGLAVTPGLKVGDIDPRCKVEHCFSISDKARAVGGGVLEALMMFSERAGK